MKTNTKKKKRSAIAEKIETLKWLVVLALMALAVFAVIAFGVAGALIKFAVMWKYLTH